MIIVYTDTLLDLGDAMGHTKGAGLTETIKFFRDQTIEIKFENLMVSWQLHFESPEQETIFRLRFSEYL